MPFRVSKSFDSVAHDKKADPEHLNHCNDKEDGRSRWGK
jgi:hypothetical protein